MSQSTQGQLPCRKAHKDSCHVAKYTRTVVMSQSTHGQLPCHKAHKDSCHVAKHQRTIAMSQSIQNSAYKLTAPVAKHTKQCIQINCTMKLWQAFFVASIIHPTVQWIRTERQTLDAHMHVNYSYIYDYNGVSFFFLFSFPS